MVSRASRVEQCIVEKGQRRSNRAGLRRPQLISVIDCDSVEEDNWKEPKGLADIMVAKFIHGKLYTYSALTPSKGKEAAKLEKEIYLLHFVVL